jgi:hypothetical protein
LGTLADPAAAGYRRNRSCDEGSVIRGETSEPGPFNLRTVDSTIDRKLVSSANIKFVAPA